ncbi:hypothetical protein COHA_002532 [Chlorella ohadii]|uniref:Uncharacterized protein n=1 Tax=Chlorella ohadii TaxID=2649997 RepID=A0AAD5H4H6_9CHLO|nr:hypothetical protein COHA_002532 [Chlorella ohadii]
MAGFAASAPDGRKIKGGRWTVARFFLVSVAFTSAWLAVSSQLDYYRKLHGPQVLLQLNIAYYLPSIPLLVVSAFLDKPLEERLGVARTILTRLLVGLVGYGAVCASFPFMPERIWFLLGATIALGLFSGIAFSASYQLASLFETSCSQQCCSVARFANKNVIALGLGCSASGPLVLALQLALQIGPEPTRRQQILLYESIALVIAAGLWATVSLLLRHWKPIEAHASKQELTEPLLQQHSPEGDGVSPSPSTPPQEQQLLALTATVWKQRSLPPLVQFNQLEPWNALSTDQEVEGGLPASWDGGLGLLAASPAESEDEADRAELGGGRQTSGQLGGGSGEIPAAPSGPAEGLAGSPGSPGKAGAAPDGPSSPVADGDSSSPALAAPACPGGAAIAAAAGDGTAAGEGGSSSAEVSATWQTLRLIWAPMAALSLSSTVALTLFPFFTYVPTSGLLGESLPKVIFFVRIFADVLGRFLPRLSFLTAHSPLTPLLVSAIKALGVPIMLLYLKSPDWMHSDVAAVIFICVLWLMGGYINTMSNMLAPRLAPAHLKSNAAGMMALAYQVAHFVGLACATLLVFLLYGKIGVE